MSWVAPIANHAGGETGQQETDEEDGDDEDSHEASVEEPVWNEKRC